MAVIKTTVSGALNTYWNASGITLEVDEANNSTFAANLDNLELWYKNNQTWFAANATNLTFKLTANLTSPLVLTAAQVVNDIDILRKIYSGQTYNFTFKISDTSANIQAALPSLLTAIQNNYMGNSFGEIVFTDSSPVLNLTPAQFNSYNYLFGLITTPVYTLNISGPISASAAAQASIVSSGHATGTTPQVMYSHITDLAISDTSANFVSSLNLNYKIYSKISSVTLTDTNTIVIANASNSSGGGIVQNFWGTLSTAVSGGLIELLKKVSGPITLKIFDTTYDLLTNLSTYATLRSIPNVTLEIGVTDTNTNSFYLGAGQLNQNYDLIKLMYGAYSASKTNISVFINSYETVSAAAAATLFTSPKLIYDNNVANRGLYILDTAANVVSNLSSLSQLYSKVSSSGSGLTGISLTNTSAPTISLTASQVESYFPVLQKILRINGSAMSGPNLFVLSVSDSSPISVAASNGVGVNIASYTVRDLGSNVLTNIANLTAAKITSISLSDTNPTLATTGLNFGFYYATFGKISSAYQLTLTGTTTADAASSAAISHLVGTVVVSDGFANIVSKASTLASSSKVSSVAIVDSSATSANWDTLRTLVSKISTITVNGGVTFSLGSLTNTSFNVNYAVISKISGPYTLSVTGAISANAAGSSAATNLTTLAVSDTGSNIAANLSAIGSLGSKVTAVTLTDINPNLAITSAAFTSAYAALGLISSSYTLSITGGVSVAAAVSSAASHASSIAIADSAVNLNANLAAIRALSNVSSIAITDTSANVIANIAALSQLSGSIGTITFSDLNPSISMAAASFNAYYGVLSKTASAYQLTVTGSVTAAAAASSATSHTTTLAVSDTIANTLTNLDGLQSLGSKLSAITLSNGTALSMTSSVFNADYGALSKITGTYLITITGGGVLNATALASAAGTSHLSSVTISDTSTNILANLASLKLLTISAITFTDSTPTLSVSAADFSSYYGVLSKVSSSYQLSVGSGTVTAAAAASTAASHITAPIAVSDTAANFTAVSLANLQNLGSNLTGITVSDSGTINLQSYAFASYYPTLNKIAGNYQINITGSNFTSMTYAAATSDAASHINNTYPVSTLVQNVPYKVDQLYNFENSINSSYNINWSANFQTKILVVDTPQNILAGLNGYSWGGGRYVNLHVVNVLYGFWYGSNGFKFQPIVANNSSASIDMWYSLWSTGSAANVTGYNLSTSSSAAYPVTLATNQYIYDSASNYVSKTYFINKVSSWLGGSGTYELSDSQITASQATTLAGISTHWAIASGQTLAIADSVANLASFLGNSSSNTFLSLGVKFDIGSNSLGSVANALTLLAQSSYLQAGQKITISDSGAAIGGSLDQLNANIANISAIYTSGPIQLNLSQLTTDAAAVAKFAPGYTLALNNIAIANMTQAFAVSNVVAVNIVDTAANIAANLNTLQNSYASRVNSITISDGQPLNLTISQFVNDSAVLQTITGSSTINLSGSGAALSDVTTLTNLGNLIASGKIGTITLTDSTLVELTPVQFSSYFPHVVAKLPNASIFITGATGADLPALLADAHVSSVSVTDTTANIYSYLGNSKVSSISIVDTASSIAASVDALETNASQISSITTTDLSRITISLTAAQFQNDRTILGMLNGGNFTVNLSDSQTASNAINFIANSQINSVSIRDTAAAVHASLDTILNSVKVSSVTLSDSSTLEISFNQFIANSISRIQSGSSNVFAISDSSELVAGYLHYSTLYKDVSRIASITTIDSRPLQITIDQLSTDSTILSKVNGGNYTLALTSNATSVDQLLNLIVDTRIVSVGVSTSSSDVSNNLNALQNNIARIGSIYVTDSNPIQVSDSQITSLSSVWSKMSYQGSSGYHNFEVIDADVAYAVSVFGNSGVLASNKHISKIDISDTADNLRGQLDFLNSHASQIASITVSDHALLLISSSQQTNDTAVLSLISAGGGNYALIGSQARQGSVSSFLSFLSYINSASYTITDTASNISSNINALLTNVGKLVAINTSDSLPISLSYSEIATNASVLSLVNSGSYTLAVSGVSASNATSVLASNSKIASVAISDTSTAISTNLNDLQSQVAKISSITTSTSTSLSLTSTKLTTDSAVLAKVNNGNYTVTISNAQTTSGAVTLFANSKVISLNISDSSSAITSNLSSLHSNINKIGSITATDNNSLSMSSSQYFANSDVLDKVSNTVAITDTRTNILSNLELLQLSSTKIASITTTDSSVFALSADQLNNNAGILAKINNGSYTVAVVGAQTVSNALTLFANSHVTLVSISDSSSAIASNLDALQANYSKTPVSITTTDNTALTLSASKFANDIAILGKISNSVVIADSSSNISANIAALQTNASKITSITTSDNNPLVLTVSQLAISGMALSKVNSGSYFVTVSDTAAHLATGIGTIEANILANKIASVTVTDNATVYVTPEQELSDYAALAMIVAGGGNYSTTPTSGSVTLFATYQSSIPDTSYTISDTSANIALNFNVLQQYANKISQFTIADSQNLSLSATQVANDGDVLRKLPSSYRMDITDSTLNVVNNLSALAANLSHISSISLSDPSGSFNWSTSQFQNSGSVLSKISSVSSGNTIVALNDYASNLSNLDLSGYGATKFGLVVTSLNADITANGGHIAKVDLTHLVDATFNTKLVNGGTDTLIDVIASGTSHSILLHGETPGQVQVAANFSSSINNITAVGLSPDGSTLLISFSSGATAAIPFSSGAGSVSLGGTSYQTSTLKDMSALSAPVYTDATGGNTGYLLPTKYTGPASLGLSWQLISNTDNAVITGSSYSEFLKVASSNSIGKAVNGYGGNDVIDGGVGSTFVTGGSGHTDTFFLDGRAPGVSWSTITDFRTSIDKATIWGFVKGVSSVDTSFANFNSEGAGGYQGLTLHFKNLLPDGQTSGSNANLNSITLTGHTLAEFGAGSLAELNAQINAGTNAHFIVGATNDSLGTHGYLQIV